MKATTCDYYLFRGHGDIVGQIARFEKFGDYSGKPIPGPKDKDGKSVKGAGRVYRPIKTMEKLSPGAGGPGRQGEVRCLSCTVPRPAALPAWPRTPCPRMTF